jgi:adenosylhomocysteine nucleosidase
LIARSHANFRPEGAQQSNPGQRLATPWVLRRNRTDVGRRMIVRFLVTQLLRNAAQHGVRDLAAEALQPGDAPIETAEIVCLFALGIESGGLVDRLQERQSVYRPLTSHRGLLDGRPLAIVETGAGAEKAAATAEKAIELLQPQWIISAGFAGALRENLKRNHFLMADSIADESGDALDVGFKISPEQLAASKGLHVGRLLTVDRLIRTRTERQQLAEKHRAVACDMESAAIAQVCQSRKVRLLSVRIISDAVDEVLPPEIERMLLQPSLAGKAGAAIGALVKRPSAAKDLWKLRDQAMDASDRLAKFLSGVAPQLEARE